MFPHLEKAGSSSEQLYLLATGAAKKATTKIRRYHLAVRRLELIIMEGGQ
jgi:hypothetical protein